MFSTLGNTSLKHWWVIKLKKIKINQGDSFRINIAHYITHKSNDNNKKNNPRFNLRIYYFCFWQSKHRCRTVLVQITSIKFHRTLYKSLKILCFSTPSSTPLWVRKQDYSSIVPRQPPYGWCSQNTRVVDVRLLKRKKSCVMMGEMEPNEDG